MTTEPKIGFWQRLLFRNWKISVKLVVTMLILSLIPLILSTVISTRTSSRALSKQTDLSADALSELTNLSSEALTEQTDISADALTQQNRIALSRLSFSTAQRIEQLLIDNHNFIRMAASDQRAIDYAVAAPEDRPELQAGMDSVVTTVLSSNPTLDLIGFYDQAGIVLAHNNATIVGQDYSSRDFFQASLQGQQFTASIQIGLSTGLPGLSASAPMYQDNEVIGVIATRIQGTFIDEILKSTLSIESEDITAQEKEAIDLYLVNEYGLVMSHSNPESDWLYHGLGTLPEEVINTATTLRLLGGVCPDDAATCDAGVRIPRVPESIPALQPLGDELLTAIDAGNSGSYRYCHPTTLAAELETENTCANGEWHVVGYAPVRDPFRTDAATGTSLNLLMVVVDVPESIFLQAVEQQRAQGEEAVDQQRVQGIAAVDEQQVQGDESVTQQRQQGLLIVGLMSAFAIIASVFVARTLARPIGKLANAATAVEHDQPFEPTDIADVTSQGDEVGNLGRVFSDMVVALRARMAELQTIYEIGNNITSSVDLKPTLFYIIDSLGRVIPFDAAEICLYDRPSNKMVMNVEAGGDMTGQTMAGRREYEPTLGYFDQLIKQGSGFLTSSVDANLKDGGRVWRKIEPRTYLGVPLKIKDQVIGTIEMVSKNPNGFSDDHLRVLESIAIQASVAVQNAQEVQTRERKLKQEIQKLRIEIDETRKTKQVEEITESDYFQSLKQKAQLMRGAKTDLDETKGHNDSEA